MHVRRVVRQTSAIIQRPVARVSLIEKSRCDPKSETHQTILVCNYIVVNNNRIKKRRLRTSADWRYWGKMIALQLIASLRIKTVRTNIRIIQSAVVGAVLIYH